MNTVYLLLGSNLGNSKQLLVDACNNIVKEVGKVEQYSSLYATAAWGFTEQPDFINQVIKIQTGLSAENVLKAILTIEKKIGRVRTIKNAARVIDIDILFFNTEIINTETLKVPHPQIENRRFVLIPLEEMDANLQHPLLHKSIKELLKICPDNLNVQKI